MQSSERNSGKNKLTLSPGDEGADVWRRVTKSTRELSKKQKNSYQAERLSKPEQTDAKISASARVTTAKQPPNKHVSKPELKPVPRRSVNKPEKLEKLDRNELRRVRRGRDAIEQTIDLHGSKAAPAQKRVEAFIRAAHANRCKWVLIITGKGEQGEGTLKKQTPIWLGALAEQGLVMGFDFAPQNMGGSGAVCVRLRRKKT